MADVDAETVYREKWAYLKHSEKIRYRAARWYFVVVGALLAVCYTDWVNLVPNDAIVRFLILGILVLYSVMLLFFFINHKVAYQGHMKDIREIDNTEKERDSTLLGGFLAYVRSLEIIASGLAGLAIYEAGNATAIGAKHSLATLVVSFLAAGAVLIYFIRYERDRLFVFPDDAEG